MCNRRFPVLLLFYCSSRAKFRQEIDGYGKKDQGYRKNGIKPKIGRRYHSERTSLCDRNVSHLHKVLVVEVSYCSYQEVMEKFRTAA
jgi:hypothetical protein